MAGGGGEREGQDLKSFPRPTFPVFPDLTKTLRGREVQDLTGKVAIHSRTDFADLSSPRRAVWQRRERGGEGGATSQEFPQTDRQAPPDFADPTCGAISGTAARHCRRLWPGPGQVRASVTGMARRATAPASYRGRPSLPGTERYPSPAPSGHTGHTGQTHGAHGADTQGTRGRHTGHTGFCSLPGQGHTTSPAPAP